MIVYVSLSELAKRRGISSSGASQAYRRGRLPEPDGMIAGRPGWLEETIDEWERKGKQ
jgi:predicted DNA-binding transcriptional regulator AlpA